MTIRILGSIHPYRKGEIITVEAKAAVDLISKGIAEEVKVKETATDKSALNALHAEKTRSENGK